MGNARSESALHLAVEANDVVGVSHVLRDDPKELYLIDENGATAFILAATKGYVEIVKSTSRPANACAIRLPQLTRLSAQRFTNETTTAC